MEGRVTSVRPIATRCNSEPPRSRALALRMAESPSNSATSPTARSISVLRWPLTLSPKARLSRTDIDVKTA